MVKRILADDERGNVIGNHGLQRPASLQRPGDSQAAVPCVRIDVGDEEEDVVDRPAGIVRAGDGAAQGDAQKFAI